MCTHLITYILVLTHLNYSCVDGFRKITPIERSGLTRADSDHEHLEVRLILYASNGVIATRFAVFPSVFRQRPSRTAQQHPTQSDHSRSSRAGRQQRRLRSIQRVVARARRSAPVARTTVVHGGQDVTADEVCTAHRRVLYFHQ
jgi:hypothetical protein